MNVLFASIKLAASWARLQSLSDALEAGIIFGYLSVKVVVTAGDAGEYVLFKKVAVTVDPTGC